MSPETEQKRGASSDVHTEWRELAVCRQKLGELVKLGEITGNLDPAARELATLKHKTSVYQELLQEQMQEMRALLGNNFLGVEEWKKGLLVNVHQPPPIPEFITRELLLSESPLHPGEVIKDTHILLYVPKSVNGQPYSPLQLHTLCSWLQTPQSPMVYTESSWWKATDWAGKSQEHPQWILIPKSDPNPDDVSIERHFRGYYSSEQENIYRQYYADSYEQASALQVMTMVLLHFAVHGERLLSSVSLHTRELEDGNRPCIGIFRSALDITLESDTANPHRLKGLALVRKG